jgi:death-on-curing protein
MTCQFGGSYTSMNDNLLNPSSFEYLLEAIQAEMFGIEIHPAIEAKAAVYMYNIISNHVFNDGNKRTGMAAAILFLKKNNYLLNYNITNADIVQLALDVAEKKHTYETLTEWFSKRIIYKL